MTSVARRRVPNGEEEVAVFGRKESLVSNQRITMVLGRNGLRDERRRRALIDETLHGTEGGTQPVREEPEARVRAKAYADAARVANHAPISVCIPKRPLSIWGLFLLGAAAIAGIESLYAYVFLSATPNLQRALTSLDVTARGSLAGWFSSAVLSAAALASSLVFLIRRHRTDDYRGRYRWWLWLSPLLLMVSVNAATGLHEVLSGVLTAWSGAEIAVGGKGWWLLAYGAVFFPIVLQLFFELWPSRLASIFYFATITAYVMAAAFELNGVEAATPLATTIAHSSVQLAAHFGVLLSVLSYGRYVYLEAHEAIPTRRKWKIRLPKLRRAKKSKRATKSKTKSDNADGAESPEPKASKRVRIDASHSKFGQASDTAPQVTLNRPSDDSQDDDGDRRLSKSERKRLRKEGQRQ